jgi:zinc transporter
MLMHNDESVTGGLVQGFVLDGQGGARELDHEALEQLVLLPNESLWLHWDRSHPQAQEWLRSNSGLSEFSCDLLLEENTRPRLLNLPNDEMLLFLRGVNLNPGAEPEDMVSMRVFADARRVISMRLRPLRAVSDLAENFTRGSGPQNASELILALASQLTSKVEALVVTLTDPVDDQEEHIDSDDRYVPDHAQLQQIRRRSASLRRFLAPQRDIYAQLAARKRSWFDADSCGYWNELNNHLTRYLEELELIRERVALILESEHRRMSEQMNRTMYRFGIITGFFLPLSFLTGLLGINVGGIPGADIPSAFILVCALMGALTFAQWWLFRRLRWL